MTALAAALLALGGLASIAHGPWWAPGTGAPAPVVAGSPARSAPPPATAASALLADLVVRGPAPMTGYEREEFGQAWADVDRNGCDTRNDILRRDLDDPEIKSGTHGCLVLAGTLVDPYGGGTIAFERGPGTSTRVSGRGAGTRPSRSR